MNVLVPILLRLGTEARMMGVTRKPPTLRKGAFKVPAGGNRGRTMGCRRQPDRTRIYASFLPPSTHPVTVGGLFAGEIRLLRPADGPPGSAAQTIREGRPTWHAWRVGIDGGTTRALAWRLIMAFPRTSLEAVENFSRPKGGANHDQISEFMRS